MARPDAGALSTVVDELLLEAVGGPDIGHAIGAARTVYIDAYQGASLEPHLTRLLALLVNGKAFYAKQSRASEVRSWIVKAVLHHALRSDSADLVTALRRACAEPDAARALYAHDHRSRISAACLVALFEAIDREPLAARAAGMRLLSSYVHSATSRRCSTS